MTSAELRNFVRGLSPYPAAWTDLNVGDLTFPNTKIYAVRPIEAGLGNKPLLRLKTKDGECEILELQVPGKKRMRSKDFLNGQRLL